MPIPVPASSVSLAPGIAGNPGVATAGMVALTDEQLLVALERDIVPILPTSDPEVENGLWKDSGFVRYSDGLIDGYLNFARAEHSQYLALLNEDF